MPATPRLTNIGTLHIRAIVVAGRSGHPDVGCYPLKTEKAFGSGLEVFYETDEAEEDAFRRRLTLRFRIGDATSLNRSSTGGFICERIGNEARVSPRGADCMRRGPAGRALEGMFIRPLVTWTAAWRFDRFQLWSETDVLP